METKNIIYSITNSINGKKYVGSALNFNKRKKDHLNRLKNGKHHSKKLQNAYNKYGKGVFEFNILEVVNDVSFLIEAEQKWIDNLKPEYNMTLIAGLNSHLGMKRSEETKKKISEALKGKKLSEEHKQKISKTLKGVSFSEERRVKHKEALNNSEKLKKSFNDPIRNQKIKKTRLKNGGYVVSDSTKQKISETLKKQNIQTAISITIEKYDLDGNLLNTYSSLNKAEKDNGLKRGRLSDNIIKKEKKEYKNFIWKLKK